MSIGKKIAVCVLCFSVQISTYGDGVMKARFEQAYNELQVWISENPFLSDYSKAPALKKIENLGAKALPYMIHKMEVDKEYGFHLCIAVRKVSKRNFRYDIGKEQQHYFGAQGNADLYIKWWKEDRLKTPALFDKYYKEWEELTGQSEQKEADLMLNKIEALGVDVLPLLAEKENLHINFFPAISRLTDGGIDEGIRKEWRRYWELRKGDGVRVPALVNPDF